MIPGYNHNVKYKERVFHVQTEDSGVENPHIITHVFVGGNIIESRKTSYADIVKNPNLSEMLVELMQDQHKSMLRDLIQGRYDSRIAERSANAATLNGPAPLNVEAGAQHRASLFAGAGSGVGKPAVKPAAPAPVAAAPVARPLTGAPPPAAPRPAVQAPPPAAKPRPVAPPIAASTGAFDINSNAGGLFGGPPPPAQPKQERIIEAETLQRAFDSKNEGAVDSIFGEDLISEKSLDEVILSYLAEDMQREG